MTIQKAFRWISTVLFFFIAGLTGMVFLLYTNQGQIEDKKFFQTLQDADLQQASDYIEGISVMVIVLIILILVLYRIAYRRISGPIKALQAQTQMVKDDLNRLTDQIIDISIGNLAGPFAAQATPLYLHSKDEFNELAMAHNQMIDKLNDTGDAISTITTAIKNARDKLQNVNQWLEKTVEERTADLHKAHIELEKAHQELSRLDQAKSEFLRLISHEIRTPLNGILGFTYLMKDLPQAPEVAEIFDILDTSVKRLEQFSRVALLITTLKTKDMDIHRGILKPVNLIGPAMKALEDKLKEKNLMLITEGEMVTAEVSGDTEMLEICMKSILENAIHYSPVGGSIYFRAVTLEGQVVMEFKDEGVGFSPEALKNLFKPFSPGEQHIDQNIGLDLTLVKMIADAHGAGIEAGNNEERGAYVRLTFPGL